MFSTFWKINQLGGGCNKSGGWKKSQNLRSGGGIIQYTTVICEI